MARRFGATPRSDGTSFAVWAPNATTVAVSLLDGTRAGEVVTLAPGDGGTFAGFVEGVRPGDGYRYVITTPPGTDPPLVTRIDPYARHVDNSIGHTIVPDPVSPPEVVGYRSPSWDDLVVYELHLGTFATSLAPDDTPIDAATRRLPYLKELGVSAIELLPVSEFAGDQSWGYNPALPFAVESHYGGPVALRRFVAAAHEQGIAVFADLVFNHLGPSDLGDSLWRFDGWSVDGRGDLGGIYFYQDDRRFTPWGETRPDYGRTEVRGYLRDNVAMWLQEYAVDGLRFDATAWIRNVDGSGDPARDIPDGWRLMQQISDDVRASQPWKPLIAEDMRGNEWVTRSTDAGGAGFDCQWDADFVTSIRGAVVPSDDSARSMTDVAAAVSRTFNGAALQRVVFTESHDADANGKTRVPTEIDPAQPDSYWAKKRSTLAAAVALTAPGIPMLFMGQEFLEDHWFSDDAALDWTNADRLPGIVLLYHDLIGLRRDFAGQTAGLRGSGLHVHHVNDVDKVLAYHRWDRGGPRDDTLVLLSFSSRPFEAYAVGAPRTGRWNVRLNSDWTGYDPSFTGFTSNDAEASPVPRDDMPGTVEIGIGAYTVVILSQDE